MTVPQLASPVSTEGRGAAVGGGPAEPASPAALGIWGAGVEKLTAGVYPG